jgi:zinc transport system substrate-binding protein
MRNVLLALALVILGVSCKPKGGGKTKVAVSIFPLYDITKRIAGDRLDVVLVLPPGKSEHGYDPTPKEIARLEGAKLGIAVGLALDGWVEAIMKNAGGTPKMIHVGERVPTIPIDVTPIGEHEAHEGEEHHEEGENHEAHEGEHHDEHEGEKAKDEHDDHEAHGHAATGAPDPHFWMDPKRMRTAVNVITAELTTLDPGGKDTFAKNAAAVQESLAKLDAAIEARAKTWTKKTIVTFHGSMSYYTARYDLRIAAVVEPLAGKEPTPQYVADVLAAIKHGNAAALFSEPQLDKRPAEVIASEGKIPLGELDPVGGGAGRDSYEALLTWNTDQLEKLLK